MPALLFGASHLPTYDWNMVHAFAVIGSARLMLLPYMMTKNIWVSTGAHILNDWTLFIIAVGRHSPWAITPSQVVQSSR